MILKRFLILPQVDLYWSKYEDTEVILVNIPYLKVEYVPLKKCCILLITIILIHFKVASFFDLAFLLIIYQYILKYQILTKYLLEENQLDSASIYRI